MGTGINKEGQIGLFNSSILTIRQKHRDTTREQMPAKMFPHLKLLCWLFMSPIFGFDSKQRNISLIKFGVFFYKKEDSDIIIHS